MDPKTICHCVVFSNNGYNIAIISYILAFYEISFDLYDYIFYFSCTYYKYVLINEELSKYDLSIYLDEGYIL
jgi:hypothetical protein